MINISTLSNRIILWDFDGVILNSMAVRDQGFVEVLKDFPEKEVQTLLIFHRKNGGLSRYVKFRYFFEEIRKESISEEQVNEWAKRFSIIMKELLVDETLLIEDSMNFVKENFQKIPMHIVSGSDQKELRFLCKELDINQYFKSIHGSPTPKHVLVSDVMRDNNYKVENVVLIGDSINDYDAATLNNIDFIGYNNISLKSLAPYIETFSSF